MIPSDGNYPLVALDSFNVAAARPTAFTGGTANTRGNDGGTSDPLTLFTVTGDVLVRMFGVCTTDLAGATATVSVGIAGNTALLLASTTATDIDANEIWNDATPAIGDTLANIAGPFVIPNGLDIAEYIGTTNVTSGQIYYICLWRPLSKDGRVVGS